MQQHQMKTKIKLLTPTTVHHHHQPAPSNKFTSIMDLRGVEDALLDLPVTDGNLHHFGAPSLLIIIFSSSSAAFS